MKLTSTILSATLVALSAAAQDTGAGFSQMFAPSGDAAATELFGLTPPLLGTDMTVGLSAPSAMAGAILFSWDANAGLALPIGLDPLLLYVDPLTLFAVAPVPVGPSSPGFAVPIPPDPRLVGLDLAMQAIVAEPTGAIGGSNLLVANLGSDPIGPMLFAMQFSTHLRAGQSVDVHTNATTVKQCVTVQVTIASTATVEILVDGVVRATMTNPGGSRTVEAPAGATVTVRNANRRGGTAITYTVSTQPCP